jgi:protein-S-isoprenylcysteine O-methyltransferase Ste14
MIGKATIHPVLFYSGKIAGYAVWLLPAAMLIFMERPGRMNLREGIALAVMAMGLLVTVLSMINLGRSTRLGLPKGKTELKTGGLYRFSRNPMYLGFNLMTLGAMVHVFHPAVGIAGAYSIFIYHLIVRGEEKFLEARYPEQYPEYKRRVRRYL